MRLRIAQSRSYVPSASLMYIRGALLLMMQILCILYCQIEGFVEKAMRDVDHQQWGRIEWLLMEAPRGRLWYLGPEALDDEV